MKKLDAAEKLNIVRKLIEWTRNFQFSTYNKADDVYYLRIPTGTFLTETLLEESENPEAQIKKIIQESKDGITETELVGGINLQRLNANYDRKEDSYRNKIHLTINLEKAEKYRKFLVGLEDASKSKIERIPINLDVLSKKVWMLIDGQPVTVSFRGNSTPFKLVELFLIEKRNTKLSAQNIVNWLKLYNRQDPKSDIRKMISKINIRIKNRFNLSDEERLNLIRNEENTYSKNPLYKVTITKK